MHSLQPSTLIPGKLQQKFSLMAPMSNVPYIPRQIVSVTPCQIYDLLETQFLVKKCGSKTEIPIIYRPFFHNIKPLPWSDPDFPELLSQFRIDFAKCQGQIPFTHFSSSAGAVTSNVVLGLRDRTGEVRELLRDQAQPVLSLSAQNDVRALAP
jgi:hypothetical protein